MHITFKLDEYDEMYDKYERILCEAEPLETAEDDGKCLIVRASRIVIPEMSISYREGMVCFYYADEEDDEPEEEGEWVPEASVYAIYSKDETDIENYSFYSSASLGMILENICRERGSVIDDVYSLDCYIETSEFITEERLNEIWGSEK